MKTRLLAGLVAVALGGLTSCSNILEENGISNSVAESGMGELRINLTTDPTVEAITKATPEDLSNFSVKIGETTYEYKDWFDKTLTVPAGDNKEVTAFNFAENDVQNFAWNTPYYKGSQTANIAAGNTAKVSIECKRANSTLVIDTTGFIPKEGKTKILYVQSLMAYAGESDQTGFDLLKKEGQMAGTTDSVCVKAGITAKIVLTPAKMDGTELTSVTTYINNTNPNSSSAHTEAAKKYKVSYTVNDKNGQATITVTVNNTVTEVPTINVEVNPYDSTTQGNQSSGNGE